ncbi:MAG TPA: SLC13 family permease [Alphaproteobacteria bacterium]|jgi:di/tricarboxylate transporter
MAASTASPLTPRYTPLLLVLGVVALLVVATQVAGDHFRLYAAAIIVGFAIASWTLGLLAEPLTTLLFFLLVILFGVATPEVAFSGFLSPAWWLLLGGSIIAAAVETTGLGQYLANKLFGSRNLTYSQAVVAVALGAIVLTFLMPSAMSRTLLLLPIVRAFAEDLGLTSDRPGYSGLILTAAASTYLPSTAVLPANIPNTILLGSADALYGVKMTYGPYLLLHFPVLGILKTVVLVWLVCWMFPEREPLVRRHSPDAVRPLSPEARRLALLLALSLVLFATDSIHGISPAWITLGAAILCILPPWGMIAPKTVSEKSSLITLLYIAGIISLGTVVAGAQLGEVVSAWILGQFQIVPGETATNVGILSIIGIALSLLTTGTGLPAVFTPLAGEFATATGLPIVTVLMLEVIAFSTVLLPYISPPIMVWLQFSGVTVRNASKLCLALGAVTILILFPIDYLWWQLLGYIP